MITKSNPFLRNDYYPDQNDIDDLNTRINEVQSDVDLLAISVNEKTEAVNGRLNTLQNDYNESFETDALKANTADINVLNVNVQAVVKDLNVIDTYTENLTVNKPVQDMSLRTPHLENTTSLNGNFYAPNILGAKFSGDISGNLNSISVNDLFANNANISNLYVNVSPTPIQSSAVLGYDGEGRVIPIHATYDVGFPENADYLWTDQAGTAFSGIKATEVGEVENLITAYGVKNAIDALNTEVTDNFNLINGNLNNVANTFNEVNTNIENIENSVNALNNTTNNMSNSLNYVLSTLESVLVVTNVSGWTSTSPLNIQGITEFRVAPLAASTMTGSDVGNGAKLNLSGTIATLCLPGFQWTTENMSRAFYNCTSLNQSIQIPNGVVDMSSTFEGCTSLDQNILIPNGVTNMYNTFSRCFNLNQNIKIPNSVTNMVEAFNSCNNLNQNIQIPNGVTAIPSAFYACTSLNQNILIPNSVTNMSSTFESCTSLNQNIQIPNSVVNMVDTFYNCSSLNQNILIPNSVTNMSGTFYACTSFNQAIQIPNSVTAISSTFYGCSGLNQNILIPNSVVNIPSTFKGCTSLNQNILIPNSVVNIPSAFNNCVRLNQNIQIPNSVTNMVEAFYACTSLNQNILIPNSVVNIVDTFYSCTSLNQNIQIPNSVTNMVEAFYGCSNLNQPDIYIYSQKLNSFKLKRAFTGCHINNVHIPTSVPKTTSNSLYNSLINGTTGITFPAANIFNDLPVDPTVWPPVN